MTRRQSRGSSVSPGRSSGRRRTPSPSPRNSAGAIGLERAIQLHESGKLDDAEKIYRQILATDPRHFESLHLLGVIESQRGNHAQAVRQIGDALKINPTIAAAFNNYGLALSEVGRL